MTEINVKTAEGIVHCPNYCSDCKTVYFTDCIIRTKEL